MSFVPLLFGRGGGGRLRVPRQCAPTCARHLVTFCTLSPAPLRACDMHTSTLNVNV